MVTRTDDDRRLVPFGTRPFPRRPGVAGAVEVSHDESKTVGGRLKEHICAIHVKRRVIKKRHCICSFYFLLRSSVFRFATCNFKERIFPAKNVVLAGNRMNGGVGSHWCSHLVE